MALVVITDSGIPLFCAFSTPVPPQYPAGTSVDQEMNDLWNGTANFQIIQSMQIETYPGDPIGSGGAPSVNRMNQGTQIVPVNGVWYLFNREWDYISAAQMATRTGEYCPTGGAVRIVVRSSTDQGQTWSTPVVVAEPNLNLSLLSSGKTECWLGDGFAYWDSDAATWHYIAQALDTNTQKQHIWNINHYTYTPPAGTTSPMARFTADTGGNPVIWSGGLWSKICTVSNDCPSGTDGEGTPEIAYKEVENGVSYYYVTFHGAYIEPSPSTVILGFRGIAKTPDFHTWIVTDTGGDLPNAPIWSSLDCQQWDVTWNPSTGCIGGGMGNSLITPEYTYMVVEGTDMTVGCAVGQHWTHGLVRYPNPNYWRTGPLQIANPPLFPVTGNWQQFGFIPNATNPATGDPVAKQHNPLLNANYPGGKATCDPTTPLNATPQTTTYARLFTDNNTVYLTYWTVGADGVSNWFHIARLQPVATSPVTNFYALNSNNPTNNPSNIVMQLASGSEIDLNSGNYPEASD